MPSWSNLVSTESAHHPTTGIILAGGAGKRFGHSKATIDINGEPLLDRVLRTVLSIADEVLIVGHPNPELVSATSRVSFAADPAPHKGPLFALASAIERCAPGVLLVVGCDMPFISEGLLRFEAALASRADAVVPRAEGRLQPLHAAYRTSIAETVPDVIQSGVTSMQGLIGHLRTRIVDQDEWSNFSPDGRCFFSINTPSDLRFAQSSL